MLFLILTDFFLFIDQIYPIYKYNLAYHLPIYLRLIKLTKFSNILTKVKK